MDGDSVRRPENETFVECKRAFVGGDDVQAHRREP